MADSKQDYLFRNAPAVLFIASEANIDAGLAAQNMELMGVSLGLGFLYNGYLRRAAEMNPQVLDWLGVGEKKIEACALLGYPDITYKRTAPRRAADDDFPLKSRFSSTSGPFIKQYLLRLMAGFISSRSRYMSG